MFTISRKNIPFLSALVFLLLFFPTVYAGTINLPQTGQTTSYETGDDGDIQAGVPWPSPRFTTVYCNTVGTCPSQSSDCDGSSTNDVMLDNLTGLMWARDGNRPLASKQWPDAVDYVVAMNSGIGLCGHTDWHLANVNELESLTNVEQTNLATWLNGQGFVNVQSNWYWSSTRSTSTSAWVVRMSANGIGSTSKGGFWNVFPVRESSAVATASAQVPKTGQTVSDRTGDDGDVQAGIAWPNPRFTIIYCSSTGPCASQVSDCDANPSTDIVTDNLTGLDWSRNANLFVSALPWTQAVSNGYTLTLCGETDWRLPNRKEIHSLTDPSETNPALQTGHPFINVQGETSEYYWTSTTYKNAPTTTAWHYYTYWGVFYEISKTYSYYIWPVRGGPVYTQSDIEVTKTDSSDPVQEGQDVTYTIIVKNNGPDTATGVVLTDTIPAGTSYVSADTTQGSCSESGGVITCSIGDMNYAVTVTVSIIVTAPSSQGVIVNTATASGTNTDPAPANNSDTEETLVSDIQFSLTVVKEGTGDGTVTTSPSGIDCGDDCSEVYDTDTAVVMTAGPDSDSAFDGWSGDLDCSDGAVTMNANKECIATFTCTITFSDVPPGYWAEDYIAKLACAEISQGYGDGTYRPTLSVNRAQMAVFIIRALEGEPPANYCGTTDQYLDVPYTYWACGYIRRLAELGISTGYGDGTYRPTLNVNRAQMAAYIIRAVEGEPPGAYCEDGSVFPDISTDHWSCIYIKRLAELGISTGYGDGTYRPANNVTRDQMAVYIGRAFLGMP